MTVKEAAEALEAALKAVDGLRVYRESDASVDPPAAVLGAPSLSWEAFCSGPTSATFPVYLIVPASGRAVEQLWDLVPLVADAIEQVPDAAVTEASPGAYLAGGQQLPSYDITVEVSLS